MTTVTNSTPSVSCGNCKGKHFTANDVRFCYGVQPTASLPSAPVAPAPTKPATEKQVAFIQRLATERGYANYPTTGLSTKDASTVIETLLAMPKAAPAPASAPQALAMGMYRDNLNGDYIRVYPAKNGGHLLAKALREDEDGVWRFHYLGGAAKATKNATRMTKEEAAAFGHQFGVCCLCGRLLTDPESVAAGIGPICADKV